MSNHLMMLHVLSRLNKNFTYLELALAQIYESNLGKARDADRSTDRSVVAAD